MNEDYHKNITDQNWNRRRYRKVIYVFADVQATFDRSSYYEYWHRIIMHLDRGNRIAPLTRKGHFAPIRSLAKLTKWLGANIKTVRSFISFCISRGYIFYSSNTMCYYINPLYVFSGLPGQAHSVLWIAKACENNTSKKPKDKASWEGCLYNPMMHMDDNNEDDTKRILKTEEYPESYDVHVQKKNAYKESYDEVMEEHDGDSISDYSLGVSNMKKGFFGEESLDEEEKERINETSRMVKEKAQKKIAKIKVRDKATFQTRRAKFEQKMGISGIQWTKDMLKEIIEEEEDPNIIIS